MSHTNLESPCSSQFSSPFIFSAPAAPDVFRICYTSAKQAFPHKRSSASNTTTILCVCCSPQTPLFCGDGNEPLHSTGDLMNIWITAEWSWKILSRDVSCLVTFRVPNHPFSAVPHIIIHHRFGSNMSPFSEGPHTLCHDVTTYVIIVIDSAYKHVGLFFPAAAQNMH
jgi:hypothetical protein